MAFMIPQDVIAFKTEGEKQFYLFLETVAKPDSDYTIWLILIWIDNNRKII